MESVKVILHHSNGLNVKPTSRFVKAALQFRSHISVRCKDREANAKRFLSVLTLGAQKGDLLEIFAEGPDETEAIDALKILVENEIME